MTDSARRQAGAFLCHTGLSISTRATVHAETAQTAQMHTAQHITQEHTRTDTLTEAHIAREARGRPQRTESTQRARTPMHRARHTANTAVKAQTTGGVRTARRIINLTRGRGRGSPTPSQFSVYAFSIFLVGALSKRPQPLIKILTSSALASPMSPYNKECAVYIGTLFLKVPPKFLGYFLCVDYGNIFS